MPGPDEFLGEVLSEIEDEKQELRDEYPELKEVFDAVEAAVDASSEKLKVLSKKQELLKELNDALNGRLEGELPLSDSYWSVRSSVMKRLNEL